jgi:hypothetical protein
MYYKLHWAQQMQDVLGGRPDFTNLLHPQTPQDRERVAKLKDVYFMDPAFIQRIDKIYGPLDWRLPDAHAIYWSEMGVTNSTEENKELVRRFASAVMQQACLRGGALPPWVTNVTADNFILWPNLDLVPKVNAAYEETAKDMAPERQYIVRNAQKNFLKTAVVLLYEYNRERDALKWFNDLKLNFTNAFPGPDANLTLDDYARKQIQSDVGETDPNKITAAILGFIDQEYFCLIGDDTDRAKNFSDLAEAIWQNYTKRLPGGPEYEQNRQRISLPPMAKLRGDELEKLESYLSPEHANYLRLKLGLPPRAAATPPSSAAPPSTEPRA